MKKALSCLLLLLMLATLPGVLTSCALVEPVKKLYVYNWGEYMTLESGEDEVHLNHEFEAWYEETYGERIEVVYSVFSSNEEMYAKLRNGSSKIDLIIPSEYMIERLIKEEMLMPLDFSIITAYEETIDPRFQEMATKPYCVPYTYGYLGLIYDGALDESLRDENGDMSWRVLWNEIPDGTDLTDKILTFNNSRDAFGIAQFILNYETALKNDEKPGTQDLYVNTSDTSRWDKAYLLLEAQKDSLQAYVMDEIYNKMESGAALLAPYYAGDYFTMVDVNENLSFAYPKEGTNFFYDAMCVPKSAKNPIEAQRYINFILGGEDGETLDAIIANAEWVGYSWPNMKVTMNLDYLADMADDEDGYGAEALSILYPESDHEALLAMVEEYAAWREEAGEDYDPTDYPGQQPTIDMFTDVNEDFVTYIYENLDNDTLVYANGRWEALKLTSAPCTEIYVLSGVIVLLLIAWAVLYALTRRYRSRYY
ncbi:MAG: extracellular solute-binding protein [Clostridia bacterium]|nr:extracellular solute-binding protein [Clostridia bacterium]